MSVNLLRVNGVKCSSISSGIKSDNALDLSLISLIEGTNTAAVFTKNIFCAAPVLVAKNHLNNNIRALLINFVIRFCCFEFRPVKRRGKILP